jgi:hypothetical protein
MAQIQLWLQLVKKKTRSPSEAHDPNIILGLFYTAEAFNIKKEIDIYTRIMRRLSLSVGPFASWCMRNESSRGWGRIQNYPSLPSSLFVVFLR